MKTFEQLTKRQQAKAVEKASAALLESILDGALRFNDALNGDDLQARIDAACEKAESMETPWFAHEYILDTCRDEVEGMARWDAEDAIYAEKGENIIHGIF